MSAASPPSVVRTLFEALNCGNVDRAVQQLAPSYEGIDRTRSTRIRGRDAARDQIRKGLTAFNPSFSLQHSVSDPPRITVYWKMEAVHRAPFLEIPPTDERVTVVGRALLTVREGEITRAQHRWDLAGLLREMHLLPDLPGGASGAERTSFEAPP